MKKKKNPDMPAHPLVRAWFALTVPERWFVTGILAIALVGITARHFHLKGEQAEPYRPEGIEALHAGGTP